MRSDNGSNFIGARKGLKEELAKMDQDQVKVEMLKETDLFEVRFNVPSASHMGGIRERQIGSVRGVLSAPLERNGTQMNDEALRTFMCKAEEVVNSRPLTAESITSPGSAEALTPNHFLTLKTKVVFPPPVSSSLPTSIQRNGGATCAAPHNEFWLR